MGARQGLADGVHVERLEGGELDEVHAVARAHLRHRVLRLLDAVQVGQDRDGLVGLHALIGGLGE
eukprot:26468-Ditylum_brightwellii.AAC.1